MPNVIKYPDGKNDRDAIVLIANTQLEVDSGTAAQSGTVSESGGSFGINKTGAGTLILKGALTYTGATTISAGTLDIARNITAASLGNLVMQGGTLALTGPVDVTGLSGSGDIVLGNGNLDDGYLTVTTTASRTYAGDLTGQGELEFQGGTLTLTGDVSVGNGQNGSILLENATLQVGDGGATGSLAGNIFANQNGTNMVVFDRSDTSIFSGSLIGAVGLKQIGTGTLVLSGVSDTIGPIQLENGTLEIGPTGALSYSTAQNIVDDSHLVFSGCVTSVYEISGTGSVAVSDGAVVSFSATNTGGTIIQDATLRLYNNSVAGAIVDNGLLQLGSSDLSATYSNNISGTGSVTAVGVFQINLTGNNSYSGGTSIAGGSLVIGRDGELGALSGALTFAAPVNGYAQLQWAAAFNLSSDRSINIAGGTGDFNTSGFNTTIAHSISGSGQLEKSGAGTLTLLAVNSFSGAVIVNGGTLRLASGASLPAVTSLTVYKSGAAGFFDMSGHHMTVNQLGGNGTVLLGGGTLTVDSNQPSEFAGAITGAGSLIKQGDGTFCMAGQDFLTGPTIVEDGVLQLGSDNSIFSFTGNIVNDAVVAFDGTIDYSGVISGNGSIVFLGLGSAQLNGKSSYTGSTLVANFGSLTVDGSIASSSAVTVERSTLGGTGTVAATDIKSGGTLAPGDGGIGKLRIAGDLTLEAGSSLIDEVAPNAADKLSVYGAATLACSLVLDFSAGDYAPGTRYNLLTAAGGLNGAFANVFVEGLADGLKAAVSYTANSVYLTIEETTRSDFNADGKSDILLQNANGSAAIWQMNGTSLTSSTVINNNPGTSWHVIGSADFSGDGKADILWQDDSGKVVIWNMDGSTITSRNTLSINPGPSWHVITTGDFNADGKADILMQNDNGEAAIWQMNGDAIASSSVINSNPATSWHIKGAGDFNGDGKSEILWQNDNGKVAIWTMNGSTLVSSIEIATNPGASWHVKGTGDFNGDGKSDILWQNDNGAVAVWLMNGNTVTSSTELATNPGPSWHVEGTGDYNGDGKADILWQNSNGQATVWIMNGTSITTSSRVSNPGTSWHVIAG